MSDQSQKQECIGDERQGRLWCHVHHCWHDDCPPVAAPASLNLVAVPTEGGCICKRQSHYVDFSHEPHCPLYPNKAEYHQPDTYEKLVDRLQSREFWLTLDVKDATVEPWEDDAPYEAATAIKALIAERDKYKRLAMAHVDLDADATAYHLDEARSENKRLRAALEAISAKGDVWDRTLDCPGIYAANVARAALDAQGENGNE